MANRYPGVTALGGGWYQLRSEVRHPKTGRTHEIYRKVQAPDAPTAAALLASARSEWLAKRSRSEPGRRRLGDAMSSWLTAKNRKLKASTKDTYRHAVTWWTAVLGDYWIDAIEARDVRESLDAIVESGATIATASGRLRVLRTFAIDSGHRAIVEGVSVRDLDVRDVERMEREGRGLTLDELRRLLEAGPTAWLTVKGDVQPAWRRAWALIATLAWTGLRFSEVAALEWGDVDLEGATLRVRRSVWHGVVGHPKARSSNREVVLPDVLVTTLREHRQAMLSGQQRGVASPLVFPSRRSSSRTAYVTNGHARKAMLRACGPDAANIDLDGRPVVHCLRHAWNNLIRQHASEVVRQALIGHADAETGAIYSAAGLDEKRAAVASVVRMVRGGG
jgi:integrase